MSNKKTGSTAIGIIVGTGFENAFDFHLNTLSVETPYGAAKVTRGHLAKVDIVLLTRHGKDHSVPPHEINHRANLWALKELGLQYVIATAATGSLRSDLLPSEIVVLDDFIDYRGNVTTYFEGQSGRVVHTDFSEPFSSTVRNAIVKSAEELIRDGVLLPVLHRTGTYLCVSGPRYETPAEVRMFGSWGADVVGMTVAAEAALARELGLSYAAIAVVTNLGTGLSKNKLHHGEVSAQMESSRELLVRLLVATSEKLFDRVDS